MPVEYNDKLELVNATFSTFPRFKATDYDDLLWNGIFEDKLEYWNVRIYWIPGGEVYGVHGLFLMRTCEVEKHVDGVQLDKMPEDNRFELRPSSTWVMWTVTVDDMPEGRDEAYYDRASWDLGYYKKELFVDNSAIEVPDPEKKYGAEFPQDAIEKALTVFQTQLFCRM